MVNCNFINPNVQVVLIVRRLVKNGRDQKDKNITQVITVVRTALIGKGIKDNKDVKGTQHYYGCGGAWFLVPLIFGR